VLEHEFEAATKNGLSIRINTVIRYRVKESTLSHLHVNVGEDYVNRLLLPEIGSRARIEIAKHTAEEVYATQRLDVQNKISKSLQGDVGLSGQSTCMNKNKNVDVNCKSSDYIELQEFLIREIVLPEGIHEAIVRKIEKTYLRDEYETRIEIATKEADRKLEEARGIAGFQEIVKKGISETYLRWRGIEATLDLAKSNNAKVVVIGGGRDGLPIILNTESTHSVQNDNSNLEKALNDKTKIQNAVQVVKGVTSKVKGDDQQVKKDVKADDERVIQFN
jgi:regulator of protease activity HflC (stomatin/prohibitin superfamily)